MSKILENLYLGDAEDARSMKFLITNEITHILTMAFEIKPFFPSKFEYLCIPAFDAEDFKINEYFPQICDFIKKAIIRGIIYFYQYHFGTL